MAGMPCTTSSIEAPAMSIISSWDPVASLPSTRSTRPNGSPSRRKQSRKPTELHRPGEVRRPTRGACTCRAGTCTLTVEPALAFWGPGAPAIEGGSVTIQGTLVIEGPRENAWRKALRARDHVLDHQEIESIVALQRVRTGGTRNVDPRWEPEGARSVDMPRLAPKNRPRSGAAFGATIQHPAALSMLRSAAEFRPRQLNGSATRAAERIGATQRNLSSILRRGLSSSSVRRCRSWAC